MERQKNYKRRNQRKNPPVELAEVTELFPFGKQVSFGTIKIRVLGTTVDPLNSKETEFLQDLVDAYNEYNMQKEKVRIDSLRKNNIQEVHSDPDPDDEDDEDELYGYGGYGKLGQLQGRNRSNRVSPQSRR